MQTTSKLHFITKSTLFLVPLATVLVPSIGFCEPKNMLADESEQEWQQMLKELHANPINNSLVTSADAVKQSNLNNNTASSSKSNNSVNNEQNNKQNNVTQSSKVTDKNLAKNTVSSSLVNDADADVYNNDIDQDLPIKTKPKKVGFVKKIYDKIIHDGLPPLPKIDVVMYKQHKTKDGSKIVALSDTNAQPIKNIEAALEDIYVDTLSDFQAGLPSIKKTAKEAAEAVGYYDTKLRFQRKDANNPNRLHVIVESIGEPVIVENRIVDIRGMGEDTPEFKLMEETLPPLQGEVFNQGAYTASKSVINQQTNRLGFFDNKWLNKSADVLLPDNTVDVSLILDTGKRYKFSDVVFYTADPDTGKMTSDPKMLPVKPEILKQLLGFKNGEPYVLDKIDQLQSNLSATRYFNIANVEQVLPENSLSQELSFENDEDTANMSNSNPDASIIVNHTTTENNPKTETDLNLHINRDNQHSQTIHSEYKTEESLSPIDFSVDASINAKFGDIEKKANQLLSMPDDRVLNEQKNNSQTFLGKLSDGVSNIAKNILPEEDGSTFVKGDSEQALLPNKITESEVKETKKVPLYVFVVSNKPYDAKFGFGYGTDTGLRTTATIENKLINRDGYQAGVSGEWTNINKKVDIHGRKPWKHPLNDTLSGNLSYEETLINQGNGYNDWATKTLQAGVNRNKINKKSGWNKSFSARYRYDELDIGNDAQSNPSNLPIKFNSSNPVQQATLLGYSINKTVADDITNPTKGYRQYYSLEAGAENLLTDTNMAIARAGASGIYSFGHNKKHQVIGRANTGYLWANDFDNVPFTLRFFTGGDQSIRGYDHNSLSPLNDSGYLTGGQILAVGSSEYNYEFKEGLRGALFADVGNAYDSEFNNKTKVGLGMGIRWASPVGSVRLDVAAGVSEKEHIPVRLHLFIGSPL